MCGDAHVLFLTVICTQKEGLKKSEKDLSTTFTRARFEFSRNTRKIGSSYKCKYATQLRRCLATATFWYHSYTVFFYISPTLALLPMYVPFVRRVRTRMFPRSSPPATWLVRPTRSCRPCPSNQHPQSSATQDRHHLSIIWQGPPNECVGGRGLYSKGVGKRRKPIIQALHYSLCFCELLDFDLTTECI